MKIFFSYLKMYFFRNLIFSALILFGFEGLCQKHTQFLHLSDTTLHNLNNRNTDRNFRDSLISNKDSLILNFEQTEFKGSNRIKSGVKYGYFESWFCSSDTLILVDFDSIFVEAASWDTIGLLHITMNSYGIEPSFDNYSLFQINNKISNLALGGPTIKRCYISDGNFENIDIENTDILESLTIIRTKISGKFRVFNLSTLPDTIKILNVDLSDLKGKIDLYSYLGYDSLEIHSIALWRTDISKITFPYSNYRLFFPNNLSISYDEKVSVYEQLLNNYKNDGFAQSYEKLDKEFKEFKYIEGRKFLGSLLNWIDYNWWDYGYNKIWIFRNALGLNFLFFFCNIFLYKVLLKDGYALDKFVGINNKHNRKYIGRDFKRSLIKLPYVFLYTSYIFWGWKLDFNNLSVKRLWLFGYILFQYITGIVCLAYIANYVITR